MIKKYRTKTCWSVFYCKSPIFVLLSMYFFGGYRLSHCNDHYIVHITQMCFFLIKGVFVLGKMTNPLLSSRIKWKASTDNRGEIIMGSSEFDNLGNQSSFRTNNRNRENIRVNNNVENKVRNNNESEAEADVRNTDNNTNIARTTISNSGNSRVNVRLNSRSNAKVRSEQEQDSEQEQNTDIDTDF